MASPSVQVGVRIPKELHKRLLNYQARRHYVTMSQSIITLLCLGLEHPEAGDFRVNKEKLKELKNLIKENEHGTDIRKDS